MARDCSRILFVGVLSLRLLVFPHAQCEVIDQEQTFGKKPKKDKKIVLVCTFRHGAFLQI